MKKLFNVPSGLLALLLGWSSAALAQVPQPEPPKAEPESADEGEDENPEHEPGKGFFYNNYHLVPTLTLNTFFDSNVFRTSPTDTPNTVTPAAAAGVLRLAAEMKGNRRGTGKRSSFDFSTGIGYDQFLSGDALVRNVSGLDLSIKGKYQTNPQGKRGFLLNGDFERATTPRTIRVSPDGLLVPTFRQDTMRLVAASRLRPTGGALEQQIAVSNELHFFESSEFVTANHNKTVVSTYTKWSFFPRTAALFDASLGYDNFFVDINRNPFANVDSMPLRLRLGALGLIGTRVQFNANVGYGNSFHRAPPGSPEDVSFSGVIGQLSTRWNIADRDIIALGYSHDFASSLFGNFIRRDQIDVNLIHAFTPQLQGTGTLRASVDRYSNLPALEDQEPQSLTRTDFPLAAITQVDYFVRKDLKLSGNFSLLANISNFIVRDLNTGGLNKADYLTVQAGIMASYTY